MILKKVTVTLVRHGESTDNLKQVWAGWKDSPLSNHGMNQAKAVGKYFANTPITAIYASDLKRAAWTAASIHESNRFNPSLTYTPLLREQNFGDAEGKDFLSAEWANPAWEDARQHRFLNGESLEDVNQRVTQAIKTFVMPHVERLRTGSSPAATAKDADGEEHIVMVAHGIAIAELLRAFMSMYMPASVAQRVSIEDPWGDPWKKYARASLQNTAWNRIEIGVVAADSAADGERRMDTGTMAGATTMPAQPPPSLPSTTNAVEKPADEDKDQGQIQEEVVESVAAISESTNGSSNSSPSASVASPSPSPSSALTAASLTPTAPIEPLFIRIVAQNQHEHLHGLMRQKGGIGSSLFDKRQRSIREFLGGGGGEAGGRGGSARS